MDGNDIPLITPGRKVRLQFEGFPAVQFSGWPEVAFEGTFGGVVTLIDSTDNGQGQFSHRGAARPYDLPWPGDRRFIRVRAVGCTNGWVPLNRVRLGYELWRVQRLSALLSARHPDSRKPTSASKPKSGETDKTRNETFIDSPSG
jgi:hypothetical protein